jgi:hypothetical protein
MQKLPKSLHYPPYLFVSILLVFGVVGMLFYGGVGGI